MNDTMQLLQTITNLPLIALVLARIGGLVIFVPFFSSTSIPAKTRIMLALAITIVVLPFVPASVASIVDINIRGVFRPSACGIDDRSTAWYCIGKGIRPVV